MSHTSTEGFASRQTEFQALDQFQQQLHAIYGVDVPHTVSDFVTTDTDFISRLTNGDKDHLKEKLLVQQEGEDMGLSLYLHTDVINSLTEQSLERQLEHGNLDNLCHAIEGISHFLYLIWRALRQHEVSLLELELQAEVDKYIVLLSLFRKLKKSSAISSLHQTLFENIRFDDMLSESEVIRYREANHYAGRYCRLFAERYLQEFGSRRMYSELREFYRLGQNAKLRRIANYPV